jgi:hypothetical protein
VTSVFKLSLAQLERLIRERSSDSLQVAFTTHALKQMKARRILRPEVIEVLNRGRLKRRPEPNLARASMECRMQHWLAGRELAIVAAVSDDSPDVVVVTAIVIEE